MKKTTLKLYNANDKNLANVRAALTSKATEDNGKNEVFTMLQRNASCRVNITSVSRKICAKTLTNLR